jgi:amino acid permease
LKIPKTAEKKTKKQNKKVTKNKEREHIPPLVFMQVFSFLFCVCFGEMDIVESIYLCIFLLKGKYLSLLIWFSLAKRERERERERVVEIWCGSFSLPVLVRTRRGSRNE